MACAKAANKRWKNKYPERAKATQEKYKENNLEKVKEIKRKSSKKHRVKHPDKYWARIKVRQAVRRGDLPKVSTCSCVDCAVKAHEYHHEDYSKPLEVVALCRQCHINRHAN